MSYFPLKCRYEINKNILHEIILIVNLIISYNMLIITGISNETINELTIYMQYYVETSEYFTDNN